MSGAPPSRGITSACGMAASRRPVISRSNPFITLKTTVRIITPSAKPTNEIQLMNVA